MKALVITVLVAVFVILSQSSVYAFGGINLLGQRSDAAQSTSQQTPTGLSNATESSISSISSDSGTRNVNFNVFNRDGVRFFKPEAIGQIFQGSRISRNGDQYTVERPGGGRLNFIAGLKNMVLSFLGQKVETDIPVAQENGNTFLPLNSMGQFFNRRFDQNGDALQESASTTPQWLKNSWLKTLNQSGGQEYVNQVTDELDNVQQTQAASQRKVFKGITATVFCSAETNLKGAYGEWLDSEDLYVALPKRFNGPRPKVSVQGPNGTFVAEIKDVGPWNINDPYWETGSRPQAETGRDMTGRRTNLAGIDLSYKLGRLLGIGGKGKVDWWFEN